MTALLARLSLTAELVVDLVEEENRHPLLNTVRVGAVGNLATWTQGFMIVFHWKYLRHRSH